MIQTINCYVGSEVPTAVVMRSSIFWGITPCSPFTVNWRFGGTFATCFRTGFLLGPFFDPVDDGDMFLRNIGWLSLDCTALYLRRQNISVNCYFITQYVSTITQSPSGRYMCYMIYSVTWHIMSLSKVVPVLMPWRRMGEWMYSSIFSWPRH
jgi:hypothetical protein